MKVVADTNTLVSGFLWDGLPASLLDAGLTGLSSSFVPRQRVGPPFDPRGIQIVTPRRALEIPGLR